MRETNIKLKFKGRNRAIEQNKGIQIGERESRGKLCIKFKKLEQPVFILNKEKYKGSKVKYLILNSKRQKRIKEKKKKRRETNKQRTKKKAKN